MIRFRAAGRGGVVRRIGAWGMVVLAGLIFTPAGLGAPGKDSAFTQSLGNLFGDGGSVRINDALTIRTLISPAEARAGGEVELLLQITVDKGSYIYSVKPQGPFSPNPTHLELQIAGLLSPKGPLRESPPKTVYDAPFNRQLRIHERLFTLWQKFRVAPGVRPGLHRVSGALKFHICDGKVCSTLMGKSFQAVLKVVDGSKLR